MKKLKINKIANWLVVTGAVNWGLAVFNVNLVQMIANVTDPIVSTVAYSSIGIAGLIAGFNLIKKR